MPEKHNYTATKNILHECLAHVLSKVETLDKKLQANDELLPVQRAECLQAGFSKIIQMELASFITELDRFKRQEDPKGQATRTISTTECLAIISEALAYA